VHAIKVRTPQWNTTTTLPTQTPACGLPHRVPQESAAAFTGWLMKDQVFHLIRSALLGSAHNV
jgi:hypothetical protein